MNETMLENKIEEAAEASKPYAFRRLSAEDMFLMFRIIGKIGVKEFKSCFEGEALEAMVSAFKGADEKEKALTAVGVSVGFEALDILMNNIPKCEKEVYKLLAQTSTLDEDVIKADAILFTEMIIDFVKKEEFPDFFRAVSKLFK